METTLPGDIPGLLRRGSPVRDADFAEDVVLDIANDGTAYIMHGGSTDAGALPGWVHMADLALDLQDPTGRVHAAWWLNQHMHNGDGPVARALGVKRWQEISRVRLLAGAGVGMKADDIDLIRRIVLHVAGRTK